MISENTSQQTCLVIGAGSGIAQTLVKRLCDADMSREVLSVSRDPGSIDDRAHHFFCDYTAAAVDALARTLKPYKGTFSQVFICNGILHSDSIKPEKRLEDIDPVAMAEVFRINSIVPALWLRALAPLLKAKAVCTLTVFSARVGSISDNRTGGWYSYRMSKAALNMLVKTAAVEYARRAPNVKLLAFHPGTTDTGLSRPFQHNVPDDKLFSTEFVADQLLKILDGMPADGQAEFIDWAGQTVAW
tara:strand:- start:2870 stop:3604 length:735 start_codon:yes stop_codon:yes gene_type:complete